MLLNQSLAVVVATPFLQIVLLQCCAVLLAAPSAGCHVQFNSQPNKCISRLRRGNVDVQMGLNRLMKLNPWPVVKVLCIILQTRFGPAGAQWSAARSLPWRVVVVEKLESLRTSERHLVWVLGCPAGHAGFKSVVGTWVK